MPGALSMMSPWPAVHVLVRVVSALVSEMGEFSLELAPYIALYMCHGLVHAYGHRCNIQMHVWGGMFFSLYECYN